MTNSPLGAYRRGILGRVERNVEIVRRLTNAVQAYWAGGSWHETLGPLYDPEIDYYPVRKFPDSTPCHGIDEVARVLRRLQGGVGNLRVGDGRPRRGWRRPVLAHLRLAGAGRGSGLTIKGDLFACYWLRGGRTFRHDDHLTEAGARRALGLDE